MTVAKARKRTAELSAVETRTGKDGKAREKAGVSKETPDPVNTNTSARDFAKKTGLSEPTVRRARQNSGASKDAPARITGADGKSYPAKSARDLAKETGLSDMTIGRARKNAGATNVAPDSRVKGTDGKSYPAKSDRAIAAEIGVDHKTVAKARKATGENSPVEKRTGKDGKARKKSGEPNDSPPQKSRAR